MDRTVTEDELARNLRTMLDRVHEDGECLTIDRAGEPIVVIVPAPLVTTWRMLAERLAVIGFPGDGFAGDVETARDSLLPLEPPAWPS